MSGLQAPSLSVRAREKRTERVVQTRQILCASSSVTAGIFADKAVRIEPRFPVPELPMDYAEGPGGADVARRLCAQHRIDRSVPAIIEPL